MNYLIKLSQVYGVAHTPFERYLRNDWETTKLSLNTVSFNPFCHALNKSLTVCIMGF